MEPSVADNGYAFVTFGLIGAGVLVVGLLLWFLLRR